MLTYGKLVNIIGIFLINIMDVSHTLEIDIYVVNQLKNNSYRHAARWEAGGQPPPQILADQLTLSLPGGTHYPHPVLPAPPDF